MKCFYFIIILILSSRILFSQQPESNYNSRIARYVQNKEYEPALKLIEELKKKFPQDSKLYFSAGEIYLNQEKFDEAILEYIKSIELQPEHFESIFGIGTCYFNKAAEMWIKENEIMDVNKYVKANDEAFEVLIKAILYMEKAYEIKPNDKFTIEILYNIYYKMRIKDPSYNSKYEDIRKKLKGND